ncbi:transposase [Rhodococcus rhodochrous]|uniref:transposase n=1 Tax=Rhodococcus rhodochrous TaxID=1829 RepID=UPI000A7757D0|nr:transposase [Rhodococcus rhodochrous]
MPSGPASTSVLSQSALSELLDAFRAGEGVDLIRESVRMVMQELIETEVTEQIGAGRYERTDARTTERNGARPRLVTTQAGDVELRIPTLRKGSFHPSILEPRRRIDQALYAVVMEAYVHARLHPQRGRPRRIPGHRVGHFHLRGVTDLRRPRVRWSAHSAPARSSTPRFAYVYLDATYLHVRNSSSQVTSMAVVVATGIIATGAREVLGLDLRPAGFRHRGLDVGRGPRSVGRPVSSRSVR